MKNCLLAICVSVFFSTNILGQSTFERFYGRNGNSDEIALASARLSDGGFIVTGETYLSSSGGKDILLMRVDSTGQMLWNRSYGFPGDDAGFAVQPTSDGGFIAGGLCRKAPGVPGDAFILKVAADGSELWFKTFGANGQDYATAVCASNDGSYLVCGRYTDTSLTSIPFYAKFSATGDQVFFVQGQTPGQATAIADAPGGGYLVG